MSRKKKHNWTKMLTSFVGIAAIAYLGCCILLLKLQKRFIFFPSSLVENPPPELSLFYEDVWLPVKNSDHLVHGWLIPTQSPKIGTLLYLHGNGFNISANLDRALVFQKLGFDVLLIDYRGYGKSSGDFPSEKTAYEDAKVAWDYLVNSKNIKPQDIFIYGHSLGGAIAIDLATKTPQTAGLIIEGSFTSIREMIRYKKIYELFPIDWLLEQRFDSINKVKSLPMPILFVHGLEDRIVPAKMSQSLYDATTSPKKLLLVPDAGHNNVVSVSGETYLETVKDFYQLVRDRQRKLAQF
ncbi:MAG: alpha/beta hydrolase [Prochloraceae cyanobacterium]